MRTHNDTQRNDRERIETVPLLTTSELAGVLRVSRTHVYALRIPYVLVGDRRRYRQEDVNAYLEARKVSAG